MGKTCRIARRETTWDKSKFPTFGDFIASFAYTGGKRSEDIGSGAAAAAAVNNPPKEKRRRKKKATSNPSTFVRVTIDGEPRVVSTYFPLPPNATNPVAIDKEELERYRMSKMRKMAKLDALVEKYRNQAMRRTLFKRRKSRCLSASEKRSDVYRRVTGDVVKWVPPPSQIQLLQEPHSFHPWRVLIICMLLNITSGAQVRKVLPGLFRLCPDAETATKVPEEAIEDVIKTLGLQRKRARSIKRFSSEYLGKEWTHVTQLHGVGKYAADAYAIFCAGRLHEVTPDDHKLVPYWKFVAGQDDDDGLWEMNEEEATAA